MLASVVHGRKVHVPDQGATGGLGRLNISEEFHYWEILSRLHDAVAPRRHTMKQAASFSVLALLVLVATVGACTSPITQVLTSPGATSPGDGGAGDAASVPAADGSATPVTPRPPAPNDPNPAHLTECTAGPAALTLSLPKLALLFQCPQLKGRVEDIAPGDTHLYVAFGSSEIVRVPVTGGAPELLAYDPTPGVHVSRLLVASPAIFYVAEHPADGGTVHEQELRMVAGPGEPPAIVASFGVVGVTGLAQDASEIYVSLLTDIIARTGRIIAINKSTFAERTVGQSLAEPGGIVVADGYVYAVSWGVGVVRVPIAGGALETVLPAPAARPGGLAVDATSVIVVDRGSFPVESDGKFLKAPKSGGAPTSFGTIVKAQSEIVFDGADVVIVAGAPPKPGDDGTEPRPVRFTQTGTMTELVSPMLAHVGDRTLAADADAFYFGQEKSAARLLR